MFAYERLFQREPSAAELKRMKSFVTSYPAPAVESWAAFARVLLASNEFLYLD